LGLIEIGFKQDQFSHCVLKKTAAAAAAAATTTTSTATTRRARATITTMTNGLQF
jgi:hypothetical protein